MNPSLTVTSSCPNSFVSCGRLLSSTLNKMKISILHATGTHTGQVTSPFFRIQIFFVLLSKSETCLEKVHCLLKVLVAAPQLLPQFCPLRPCLVLDSIVGWAVLKMCLRVWGTVPQGHSSAWEICFTLQFASWHPLICH